MPPHDAQPHESLAVYPAVRVTATLSAVLLALCLLAAGPLTAADRSSKGSDRRVLRKSADLILTQLNHRAAKDIEGVVFDLLFWAIHSKQGETDIHSPLQVAVSISASHSRDDLAELCKAAEAGSLGLPIPNSSESIRNFQELCRRFEPARRAALSGSHSVVAELGACIMGFSKLGAELAAAFCQEMLADFYLFKLSQHAAAEKNYECALAVYGRYNMDTALARVYNDLAYSYQERGMFGTAQAALVEAGERFAASGRLGQAADCFLRSARCLILTGERQLATRQVSHAANFARRWYAQGGHLGDLVSILNQAAEILAQAGEPQGRVTVLKEAAKLTSSQGDKQLRISTLCALADALSETGYVGDARQIRSDTVRILNDYVIELRERLQSMQRVARTTNAGLAHCFSELGWAYQQQGSYAEAARAYAEAARYWESMGDRERAISALIAHSDCMAELAGSRDTATRDLIANKAEKWLLWDIAYRELLNLARNADLCAQERSRYYERAASAARQAGNTADLFSVLVEYGQFLAKNGNPPEAARQVQAAINMSGGVVCSLSELSHAYLLLVETAGTSAGSSDLPLLRQWADHVLGLSQNAAPVRFDSDDPAVTELLLRLLNAELAAANRDRAAYYARMFAQDAHLAHACQSLLASHPDLEDALGKGLNPV